MMQIETNVAQVILRTRDVKSIRLKRPNGFDYLPGQWIFLTVGRIEEQKTKPLTLSSSPTEDYLEITKRLTGHEFSNAVDSLNEGDRVFLRGPYGNFTFHGEFDKLGMLSGGIGITPLRSIIRYATDRSLKTSIHLLYSNRDEDSIPFKSDFDAMQRSNPNLEISYTITNPSRSWKGLTGRINRDIIEKAVPDYSERVFYTCGPKPMVDLMRLMLNDMGLPESRIKQENFSGYDS
jgi:ferredoxin-NADP reductase